MGSFLLTMEEIVRHLSDYCSTTVNEDMAERAVDMILAARKVFIYGAGRSGMVGRMFAQRLMHLDLKAYYLSETITPAFKTDDCLVIISGSGETLSPKAMAQGAKDIGGKVIVLTANPRSTLGKLSDHVLLVKGQTKDAKQESLAPFTSLFDITAITVLDSMGRLIMDRTGKTEKDIDETHATIE